MNAVQKLRQIVGEIRANKHPVQIKDAWELSGRLLGRMSVNAADIDRICKARDIEALDALIARIENPQAAVKPAVPKDAPVVSEKDMESALRAFRKRLKVSRLADESKLGARQMTSGRKSEIDAMLPPHEFPNEVWVALAAAGKLKHTGKGFYALPEDVSAKHLE